MQTDRSILDSVRDDVRELQSGLGQRDKGRLGEYLDNVREIEQRIQRAEKQNSSSSVTVPDAPVGIPESFSEHMMLMFDLLAVAWQADVTRVFSYMLNRDVSQRVYPEINVTEPHHAMSHHGKDAKKLDGLVKLNTWQISLFARFVEKLTNTPDGDGSMLDHSVIFWGSGMSESDLHYRLDVPTLLVGRATASTRATGTRWRREGNADRQLPGGRGPEVRRGRRQDGSQHGPSRRRVATVRVSRRADRCSPIWQAVLTSVRDSVLGAAVLQCRGGCDGGNRRRGWGGESAPRQRPGTAITKTVRALLKQRANVNVAEADGTTALHWAIRDRRTPVAEALIRAGANVKAANRYAMTPLAWPPSTATRP